MLSRVSLIQSLVFYIKIPKPVFLSREMLRGLKKEVYLENVVFNTLKL